MAGDTTEAMGAVAPSPCHISEIPFLMFRPFSLSGFTTYIYLMSLFHRETFSSPSRKFKGAGDKGYAYRSVPTHRSPCLVRSHCALCRKPRENGEVLFYTGFGKPFLYSVQVPVSSAGQRLNNHTRIRIQSKEDSGSLHVKGGRRCLITVHR